MIVEILKHGEYNETTGKLTENAREKAKLIAEGKKYNRAFSGESLSCRETAGMLYKGIVVVSSDFNDLAKGEDPKKRIFKMIKTVFSFIRDLDFEKRRILIVSHNNLILAINYFLIGKEMPENLDELPIIPQLKGIKINISKEAFNF